MMNAESLLDISQPFNVELFDQVVKSFFEGNTQYQDVLVKFQNLPHAWMRVHDILEKSQSSQCKMIGLNILEDCVKTRWKILSKQHKDGIKTYIVNLIIKISSNTERLKQFSVFIRKLNVVLVQIAKQDWPQNWPNFIPELVNSSKVSQSMCANNMNILLLLSEEVFDYSQEKMTQEKMKTMKTNLNREFTLIFQLCEYILDKSQDPNLLTMTLQTLLRFLKWIPVGYIFETKLIETLSVKFFPVALFQNDTLRCLTEIASLKLDPPRPQYHPILTQMFVAVISSVEKVLTPASDVPKVYASGDPNAQTFVRHLALFIPSFLNSHMSLLEGEGERQSQVLLLSLRFLLRISKVDDVIIFKICLDYWCLLVAHLYMSQQRHRQTVTLDSAFSPRVKFYQVIFGELRKIVIFKMAKPEEVLIVEDENGQIVREQMRDTDSITLYKNMRECLIFLTHLDPVNTQKTMLTKLNKQVDGSEWSWHNLNTLCWAIGSISGALSNSQEKHFLVRVIKDLLGLCEMKRGKDNKAVIASNIMYVVGQYPRFLRQHWKFLKAVVNKLIEFMHELHPGVQDMSCDTFLKISKKCHKKFVITQMNESRPFIEEILENMPETSKDLETSQIHTLYEAMAHILQQQDDQEKREVLLFKLMELPNQSLDRIIAQANENFHFLYQGDIVKQTVLIIKTNIRVVGALGHGYFAQFSRIYNHLLQIYKIISKYVSDRIQREGEGVIKLILIRDMRAVKRAILKLIQCFVKTCQDSRKGDVYNNFLPKLMFVVLQDYGTTVPDARDAEVLLLFSTIVSKLGSIMVQHVPTIFDSVFQATLDMITKNFQDYPEHRLMFFKLIQAINTFCFQALLRLGPKQFRLVIDSVIWAIKHLQREIAEIGLMILLSLIKHMEKATDVANPFFKAFFMRLLKELLEVLTDTFHKPGFPSQSIILQNLFRIVATGSITVPLWEEGSFSSNQAYVQQQTVFLLTKAFPNLTRQQVEKFVSGLIVLYDHANNFTTHLRDFLIQMKEFNKTDNTGLFQEEQKKKEEEKIAAEKNRVMKIPGLLYTGPSSMKSQNNTN